MNGTRKAALLLLGFALPQPALAQDSAGPGDPAPPFVLPAATKDGVAPVPVRLLDFRGQTVVLAFFYKARTGG